MMKKTLMFLAVAVICVGTSFSAQKSATFSGDIMDSACAKGGAHNPAMGNAKACTEACVKAGSKYVLYDGTTKTVYQLDDQKKPDSVCGSQGKRYWHSRRRYQDDSRGQHQGRIIKAGKLKIYTGRAQRLSPFF